ncbi:hypothetical protein FHG87_022537, partial [Trinorchestia longiramus]
CRSPKTPCSSPTHSCSAFTLSLPSRCDSGVSFVSTSDSCSNSFENSSDGGCSNFDEPSMVSIAVDDMISSAFERSNKSHYVGTEEAVSECIVTVNG